MGAKYLVLLAPSCPCPCRRQPQRLVAAFHIPSEELRLPFPSAGRSQAGRKPAVEDMPVEPCRRAAVIVDRVEYTELALAVEHSPFAVVGIPSVAVDIHPFEQVVHSPLVTAHELKPEVVASLAVASLVVASWAVASSEKLNSFETYICGCLYHTTSGWLPFTN